MKRWLSVCALALLGGLMSGGRALAEDAKPLTLTVVTVEGKELDLIKETKGAALVVFIDPARFKDEDAKALTDCLQHIAKEAEAKADGKATHGQPGVMRLEEAEAAKDERHVVLAFMTNDEAVWEQCKKDWEDPEFFLVRVDPTKDDEELKPFELPNPLTWAAFLIVDSKIKEGYLSVKDLQDKEAGIAGDID